MAKNIKIIDDIGIDNELTSKKENLSKAQDGDNKMDELEAKKLEELKARLAESDKSGKAVSLKFGVLGLGHAGSRVSEEFYKLGYPAIAINTAMQDLACINIPNENKLYMDIGLAGAAKDMIRGEEAAIQYKSQIQQLMLDELDECQVLIIISSSGGGSGAGSLSTVIDICNTTGKPIILMTILPKISEDSKTKSNSLETIAKLTSYINEGRAQSLILIDNARIESIHCGVGTMDFYKIANEAIVKPLDIFNFYSMMPSEVKAFDSSEFASVLLNSTGITTYGEITIDDYEGELAISKAVIDSLQKNMLVSGLELKGARYVGYIMLANSEVWSKIPAGAIDYCGTIINDIFGSPESSFHGLYTVPSMKENVVKILTMVSGLSVPEERINNLKKEIESQQINLKTKEVDRFKNLKIDLSKDSTTTDVEKIKQKISAKLSGLGKLNNLGRK